MSSNYYYLLLKLILLIKNLPTTEKNEILLTRGVLCTDYRVTGSPTISLVMGRRLENSHIPDATLRQSDKPIQSFIKQNFVV